MQSEAKENEKTADARKRADGVVERLTREGKPVIVDIGASKRRRGTVTLDLHAFEGVDVVYNIAEGLPFGDNTLDGAMMFHVIEHLSVDRFEPVFREIWRCCKPGARVEVRVPHFSCGLVAWSDPTHVRPYGLETFTGYLCGSERLHFNASFPKLPAFAAEAVSLRYYAFREDRTVRLTALARAIDWIANRTPWVQRQFERRLAYLIGGFEEVEAILRVIK